MSFYPFPAAHITLTKHPYLQLIIILFSWKQKTIDIMSSFGLKYCIQKKLSRQYVNIYSKNTAEEGDEGHEKFGVTLY